MSIDRIEKIINMWADMYGKTFNSSNRKERLAELIMDLVHNDFTRADIQSTNTQKLLLSKMVGTRAKFGTLKNWEDKAKADIRAAILNAFVEVKVRTEDIIITPEEISLTPEQIEEIRSNQESTDISETETNDDELEQTSSNGFRPELDLSLLPKSNFRHIVPVDDFFESLERENNE